MRLPMVFIPLFWNVLGILCDDDQYNKYMQDALSQGLDLFSGLDKVLTYLRDNETNALSRKILETFEKECLYMEDPEVPRGKLRKPFIVIEGNHRPSRDVVGMRLAKMMGGRFMIHPAPCLAKYLSVLPKGSLLRRAFYMLSLYAQAFNAKVHLSLCRTVVLNGYWLEQLGFHLIQSFPSGPLPASTSNIFKFPSGLLKPDVIFYLNIPDNLKLRGMTTRSPISWKPRSLNLYMDLQNRFPIVVETLTGNYRSTVSSVYQFVCENISNTRDIWPHQRQNIDFDYAYTTEIDSGGGNVSAH